MFTFTIDELKYTTVSPKRTVLLPIFHEVAKDQELYICLVFVLFESTFHLELKQIFSAQSRLKDRVGREHLSGIAHKSAWKKIRKKNVWRERI